MKLSISALSTTTLASLAQMVINHSKKEKHSIIKDHPLLIKVEKEYEKYYKVYSKLSFSGKGKEVANLDKKRNQILVGLKYIVKGYAKIVTLPEHQTATNIFNQINNYARDITRLSYSSETAQIKKLIEVLESEENKEQIKKLHLTSVFNELKKVQTEFETLYLQQANANAQLRALPSATVMRKDLEQALKSYFQFLDAMKSLPDWKIIYNDVNEFVKSANNS